MAKTYDDEHMAPHGDSCMMSEHMLGLPKCCDPQQAGEKDT